jgi:PAS domain S-box-containing protein
MMETSFNFDRVGVSLSEDGQYQRLVGAVTDYAIYILDADGVVTSWNPGAQRFKGYEASEIIGRHFSCFYTDEDQRSGLPARALEIAAETGAVNTEGWRVRKDGTRFWAQVSIDPIREPSGRLIGFAKITRDVSERKLSEVTRQKAEQQFTLLVRSVFDYAIYMLDSQGLITTWNSGAERIKGFLPGEIIGQHFRRFYSAEDQQNGEPERALETAIREGRFESEGWRMRKNGSRFWADVVLDRVCDENGAIVGFAKVTRDFTERREAQRTIDQTKEALFQSQKMEAVGQLTSGISHDFANILMAVLVSLELARKRLPDDPKLTRLFDDAIQGARRGTALTQRMLVFARQHELKPERVDLPSLILGIVGLLQTSVGASIMIETQFTPTSSPVRVDPNQLELVLLNLALNARDSMPEGGSVVISVREESVTGMHKSPLRLGRYACLAVSDTGVGMDPGTLSRATEPFFTTKASGRGTGLGLSMAHGLALQSGGQLILSSRKGFGTSAEIWLPLATQHENIAA